jgi:predicted transcriptional regulator
MSLISKAFKPDSFWARDRGNAALPLNTVARAPLFSYLEGMEVHFNPDLQAKVTQRATQQGRDPDEVVQDVVARYFEEEDRFIEAVKRGEAALERGEWLTHEQVGDRLRRFLQP